MNSQAIPISTAIRYLASADKGGYAPFAIIKKEKQAPPPSAITYYNVFIIADDPARSKIPLNVSWTKPKDASKSIIMSTAATQYKAVGDANKPSIVLDNDNAPEFVAFMRRIEQFIKAYVVEQKFKGGNAVVCGLVSDTYSDKAPMPYTGQVIKNSAGQPCPRIRFNIEYNSEKVKENSKERILTGIKTSVHNASQLIVNARGAKQAELMSPLPTEYHQYFGKGTEILSIVVRMAELNTSPFGCSLGRNVAKIIVLPGSGKVHNEWTEEDSDVLEGLSIGSAAVASKANAAVAEEEGEEEEVEEDEEALASIPVKIVATPVKQSGAPGTAATKSILAGLKAVGKK
jgi:hypothetical protein